MATTQQRLFAESLQKVVNVSQVRQLSPFRYPGGKTWLIPRARLWLYQRLPKHFIEPFAGGGIVSLSVAAEHLAQHITMVELDEQVAAVWKCIFTDGDGEWLGNRIVEFPLTLETLREELSKEAVTTRDKAFQTILKNRTFHGGILAPGSGVLKFGEKGKGVLSRWYPDTLKKRILVLNEFRDRITFIQDDAFKIIEAHMDDPGVAFFVDPPYTAAGKKAGRRLYNHCELDHDRLFELMRQTKADVLMTYDDAEAIREMAERHDLQWRLVAMQNTHHTEMKELLIGKDLSWLGPEYSLTIKPTEYPKLRT